MDKPRHGPELSANEVAKLPRCDVSLLQFGWLPETAGVELLLEPIGKSVQRFRLNCHWVAKLAISIAVAPNGFGDSSAPFTWDTQFNARPGGGWSVSFDFASRGSITFDCDALSISDAVARAESKFREPP